MREAIAIDEDVEEAVGGTAIGHGEGEVGGGELGADKISLHFAGG